MPLFKLSILVHVKDLGLKVQPFITHIELAYVKQVNRARTIMPLTGECM